MKKIMFFLIGIFLLFLGCTKNVNIKKPFFIYVNCKDSIWNDRNGEDYIKLWVNDSLLFSGTYYTNYIDSTQTNLDDALGMKVATIDKANRDSIKIRIRLVSLDSVLFANKRVMDTTFCYRINNIPWLAIGDSRRQGFFLVFDSIKALGYGLLD
ncbi:hypothetical protein [uncultured Bacteroides sp.]|uniref:hypothetical protein n=1 Tax=uncultured Bacteroides sp. TaxID=162156 RepID=UPI002AA6B77B|nr:hypothetical protein [uncultured Bacteroides sp.]